MFATTSWLQKHPSPKGTGWEFHWYSRHDSEVADVVATLAGGRHSHPFFGLLFRDGALWWLRSFEGKAPSEQRRYSGLVVEKIDSDQGGGLAELLAGVTVSPAEPWTAGSASIEPREVVAQIETRLPAHTRRLSARVAAAGARLKAEVIDDLLPHGLARLLPLMPELEDRMGAGIVVAAHVSEVALASRTLAHYLELVAFGAAPPEQRMRAWTLANDFARTTACDRAQGFAELAELAKAWTDSKNLWRYLRLNHISRADLAHCDNVAPAPLWHDGIADAGWLWNRILNYWGRGFLADGAATWIAQYLLGRIAVDHLYGLEHEGAAHPWRYLSRLRWEALLPAERARAMLAQLAERSPTLLAVTGR